MVLCFALFTCFTLHGQVSFFEGSFEKALRTAKKENKILMVILEAADCEECNAVTQKTLASPDAYTLQLLAITYFLPTSHEKWPLFASLYFPNREAALGVLFFNDNGDLIHRYPSPSSEIQTYIQQASFANRNKQNPLPTAANYMAQLAENPEDTVTIRKLVFNLRQMGKDAQPWIDKYASLVAAKGSITPGHLTGIATLAPELGSYADSTLRRNPGFKEAWYSMPLPIRVNLNKTIVFQTTQKAILSTNTILARTASNFAVAVNEEANPYQRQIIYAQHMAIYYRGINDTMHYLNIVRNPICTGLLALNADSIIKADEVAMAKIMQGPAKQSQDPNQRSVFSYSPKAQFMAIECKKYASDLFTMSNAKKDEELALQVAEHGLKMHPLPSLYSTYAKILYHTGNRTKAIEMQRKAQEQQLRRTGPLPSFEKLLEKMENGTYTKGL